MPARSDATRTTLRPQPPHLHPGAEIRVSGRCVQVRVQGIPHKRKPPPRNVVRGMTRKSRLNLLTVINRTDWEEASPVTQMELTFPNLDGQPLPDEITRYRAEFWRRLERRYGQLSAIWRTEWKVRQSGERAGMVYPHFHLVIARAPYMPQDEVTQWWSEVLGCNARVWLQNKEGLTAAMYAAKYAAKQDEASFSSLVIGPYLRIGTGRPWGIHRANLWPMMPWESVLCDRRGLPEALRFLACEAGLLDVASAPMSGFRLFGPWADKARALIAENGLTPVMPSR